MQKIQLNKRHYQSIIPNESYNTFLCHEQSDYSTGTVTIGSYFNGAEHKGLITNVYSKMFSELSADELLAGGYANARLLSYDLAMQYTRFIEKDDIITIVCFTIPTEETDYETLEFESYRRGRLQSVIKLAV